jgi:hypothetical protein
VATSLLSYAYVSAWWPLPDASGSRSAERAAARLPLRPAAAAAVFLFSALLCTAIALGWIP